MPDNTDSENANPEYAAIRVTPEERYQDRTLIAPLSDRERALIGLAEIEGKDEPAPHEWMVIRWLRAQMERASSPYEATNVAVLMVGEADHVGVVNHQLDHIGGGLASVIRGETIAMGEYQPAGMYPGEECCRSWAIEVNMLQDQTDSQDSEKVTMPNLGEMAEIFAEHERTRDGVGTLDLARQMLTAFPKRPLKLVSKWYHEVKTVRTVEEAEAFFVEHGEWAIEQRLAIDACEFINADTTELVAQVAAAKGIPVSEVIAAALKAALEGRAL